MAEPTEEDRVRAKRLVLAWDKHVDLPVAPLAQLRDAIAATLAEERERAEMHDTGPLCCGRCGRSHHKMCGHLVAAAEQKRLLDGFRAYARREHERENAAEMEPMMHTQAFCVCGVGVDGPVGTRICQAYSDFAAAIQRYGSDANRGES